jgi:uncharacterized protein with GYD domain
VAKPNRKAATAFILMDAAPGEAHNLVMNYLKSFDQAHSPVKGASVRAAWVIAGEHDAIAKVEADSNSDLLSLVTKIVQGSHKSPGTITKTVTMFAEDGPWID